MRRGFFTWICALSLVLCAGTCVMWVRSYTAASHYPEALRESGYRICSSDGRIFIQRLATDLTASSRYIVFIPVPRIAGDRRDLDWCPARWRLLKEAQGMANGGFISTFSISFARASMGNGFGFGMAEASTSKAFPGWVDVTTVAIPYWFVLLGTIVMPIFELWGKRTPWGVGRCRGCGYDLQATPQRCPECGTLAALPMGR